MAVHFQSQKGMSPDKFKVMMIGYATGTARFVNNDLAKIAAVWAMDTYKQKGSYYRAGSYKDPAVRYYGFKDRAYEIEAVTYLVNHVKVETLMKYLDFVWHFNRLAGLQGQPVSR
jgi:hypothetical protein